MNLTFQLNRCATLKRIILEWSPDNEACVEVKFSFVDASFSMYRKGTGHSLSQSGCVFRTVRQVFLESGGCLLLLIASGGLQDRPEKGVLCVADGVVEEVSCWPSA